MVLLETMETKAMTGKIVNRVSVLLGERRWSITDLQRATGLSYPTVHAWYHDSGQQFDRDTLAKLCEAFGVQPGEILKYKENEPERENGA
jgi:DNA-binding Xre family transcriptional regulator